MFQLDEAIDAAGTPVSHIKPNAKLFAKAIEARKLWESMLSGSMRAKATVMETMTTSDFPVLLGVSYARELRSEYQGIAPVWQKFATRTTVPDFRKRKLADILGGIAGLEVVPEASEYPARKLTESSAEFQLRKRGARIPLTWEMLKNDNLGAFANLPSRLAIAARETEDIAATDALLKADRSDVNLDFFKAANNNAPTALPLTRDNLKAALAAIFARKAADGRPINFGIGKPVLMVPQALAEAAADILAASEIEVTDGNGVKSRIINDLGSRVELVVNPWLDVRNTNAKAATTWFILPPPNAPRVAVVVPFLAGNESPDLRVSSDTGSRVGGGLIAPEEGAFKDDTIQYRVRHCVDAATIDPMLTYVSRGA